MDNARRAWAVKSSCIALAVALNWAVQGYQFGYSNHTVYLLDAVHRVHPELLGNDWFTTQTFQYHALFGVMTRLLMRLNIAAPAFLVGYVALLVAMHTAWWRLVRILGGGAAQFLVSQVLFQLMAAGAGLGMYMFLQDSCFLPSNIAAVALLCGIVLALEKRPLAAGIAMGVAGAFHLNYAPVVMVLWVLLHARRLRKDWLATFIAVVPAAANILFALKITAGRTGIMPLGEFVEIYVRLRHPHHYDPSSWPAWLWVSVLLPVVPAAIWWWRRRRDDVVRQLGLVFLIFALLVVVALIGAGTVYWSESLIQASFYRFSIFPKLLACIGTAFLVCQVRPWLAGATAAAIGAALAIACLIDGPYLGAFRLGEENAAYESACAWIRGNTPVDAVFLVPPNDERFRLSAQRAIVVNFKCVPQLSGELIEWRRRMETALDLSDLRMLPRPHSKTLAAIRDRYNGLPPQRLIEIARKCGARYIFTPTQFGPQYESLRLEMNGNSDWFLYDLGHGREGN